MDRIDKSIVNELIQDPHLSSKRISKKIKVPLSTVQRRRTALERSILNKMYSLDLSTFGWRIADLLIGMHNGGDPHSTASNIVQENSKNIVSASLRIGSPEVNLGAQIRYKSSQELHKILQKIKALDNINSVGWSEIVEEVAVAKVDVHPIME